VEPAKPSLELLRSLTDEHVLRTLMRHRRLTRAELAAETGISKPTVGESVRRLAEAGLVADTGERTAGGRGRGRVGTYYALAGVGVALALSIAPAGIVAEWVDAYGDTVSRAEQGISRPARPDQVTAALRAAVAGAQPGSTEPETTGPGTTGPAAAGPPRLAVVSAADPVDRATGRLIHLPDAPFLLGDLDPVRLLAPYVGGPVTVDNDVNWAARAERDCAPPGALRDFAYLYLDEGMGCAIVSDAEVRRGAGGLAGEVAHLITTGPQGQAMPLIDVFGALDLRRPGSTAIDVSRLLAAVSGGQPRAAALRDALGRAVSGVLAAVVALSDPELIVIGGAWGAHPLILDAVTAAFTRMPRHAAVRAAKLGDSPALAGARADALSRLRAAIVATARQRVGPPR
jgi:predicted NBD/HSP70 family sugar kinase